MYILFHIIIYIIIMPKRMKLSGKKKEATMFLIGCCIVCLILSLIYIIIEKYAFGKDKPFSLINF